MITKQLSEWFIWYPDRDADNSIYSLFNLLVFSEIVVLWRPFKISVHSWTSLWRGVITKWLTMFRNWTGFSERWIESFVTTECLTGAGNDKEFLFSIVGLTCSFIVFSNRLMPGNIKLPSLITLFARVVSSSLIYRTASSTTSI